MLHRLTSLEESRCAKAKRHLAQASKSRARSTWADQGHGWLKGRVRSREPLQRQYVATSRLCNGSMETASANTKRHGCRSILLCGGLGPYSYEFHSQQPSHKQNHAMTAHMETPPSCVPRAWHTLQSSFQCLSLAVQCLSIGSPSLVAG